MFNYVCNYLTNNNKLNVYMQKLIFVYLYKSIFLIISPLVKKKKKKIPPLQELDPSSATVCDKLNMMI